MVFWIRCAEFSLKKLFFNNQNIQNTKLEKKVKT